MSSYQEEAWNTKRPIPFEIYKGVLGKNGVLRFKFIEPYSGDRIEKPKGYIELEAAPADGKNHYDWDKRKIKVNLTYVDVSKILLFLGSPCHSVFQDKNDVARYQCYIIHDRGISSGKDRGLDTNTIRIEKPENRYSFDFNLERKADGEVTSKVYVPVGPEDVIILGNLLKSAIPKLFSWD